MIKNIEPNHYTKSITRMELRANLNNGLNQTIFFYDKDCEDCTKVANTVFKTVKDYEDIELIPLLIDESTERQYEINKKPTIVHFIDNKEIVRIKGVAKDKEYKEFFEIVDEKNKMKKEAAKNDEK